MGCRLDRKLFFRPPSIYVTWVLIEIHIYKGLKEIYILFSLTNGLKVYKLQKSCYRGGERTFKMTSYTSKFAYVLCTIYNS